MSQRSSRSRRMARAAGPLALFPFLLTPAGKIGAGALATALIAGGMLAKAPPDAPNPVAGGPRPAASTAHPAGAPEPASTPGLIVEVDGAHVPVVLTANAADLPRMATLPEDAPPSFPGMSGLPGTGGLPGAPQPAPAHAPGHRSQPPVADGTAPSPLNVAPAGRPQPSSPSGGAPAAAPGTGMPPTSTPDSPPIASGQPNAGPVPTSTIPAPGGPLANNPPAGNGPGSPGPIADLPGRHTPQPAAPPSAAPPGAGTPLPAANLPPETTGLPLADPLPGNPPVTGLPDAPLFQPALLPQAQTAANSVPEPGSLMLLAFGGMVLWWMRRPRGRQAVVTPAAC